MDTITAPPTTYLVPVRIRVSPDQRSDLGEALAAMGMPYDLTPEPGEPIALDWPDGEDEVETARLVANVVRQILKTAGLRDPERDAVGEAPEGYFFGGGYAPNGVPVSVQVNVTP